MLLYIPPLLKFSTFTSAGLLSKRIIVSHLPPFFIRVMPVALPLRILPRKLALAIGLQGCGVARFCAFRFNDVVDDDDDDSHTRCLECDVVAVDIDDIDCIGSVATAVPADTVFCESQKRNSENY